MTELKQRSVNTAHNKTDPDLLLARLEELQLGTLTVTGVSWQRYGGKNGVAMATTYCTACKETKDRAVSNLVRGLIKRCKCQPRKWVTPAHQTLAERYHAMVQRCNSPKHPDYKNYGGRGITLEFQSSDEFVEWMLTNLWHKDYKGVDIDRIHNSKGYKPGNLRLVTRRKNLTNTRKNKFVTYRGAQVVQAHMWDLIKTDYPEFPYGAQVVLRLLREGTDPHEIPKYRRTLPGGRKSTTSLKPDPEIVSLYRES